MEVTLLHPRAGEPNWGPELLARCALSGALDELPRLWRDWERWAADVSESHSSYPILIQTRSARPIRSWWVALLAVMDSAALSLALRPGDHQNAARVLLRQGVECMRELAHVSQVGIVQPRPGEEPRISLTFAEFHEAVQHIERAGFVSERSATSAWPYFVWWRAWYEQVAYDMADRLDAVPAPWSGPRRPTTPVIWPERSAFYQSRAE